MHASSQSPKSQVWPVQRVETAAVYAALSLIAAIVFGTISFHPF